MPPALFSQSIRLEKQRGEKNLSTYLAPLCAIFHEAASSRKTNNNQPMAYLTTVRHRSRRPANSWDLQRKLHAYIYEDEGGTSGRQSAAVSRGYNHAKPPT